MAKPEERLIVAIDEHLVEKAILMIQRLMSVIEWFKIGSQLMYAGHAHSVAKFVHSLGKNVFWDNKIFDIPETSGKSVQNLVSSSSPEIFSIYAGEDSSLEALKLANWHKGKSKMFGVSLLTSDRIGSEEEAVSRVMAMAARLYMIRADGVICPAFIAERVKAAYGLKIISPGICAGWHPAKGHAMPLSAGKAIRFGADQIVVGSAITRAPKSVGGPRGAAEKILEEIAKASR